MQSRATGDAAATPLTSTPEAAHTGRCCAMFLRGSISRQPYCRNGHATTASRQTSANMPHIRARLSAPCNAEGGKRIDRTGGRDHRDGPPAILSPRPRPPRRPHTPFSHLRVKFAGFDVTILILFFWFCNWNRTLLILFAPCRVDLGLFCAALSSSHVKTRGCGAARGRHEGAASAGGPSAFQQACPGRGSCWGSPSRAACCSRVRPRFPSLEAASCRGLQVGEMGARGVLGLVLAVLGVAAALAPASSGQCALHRA